MKIEKLIVRNFRTLLDLELVFDSGPVILIGDNGSGKTSILSAIARAAGSERAFSIHDFADVTKPIEIVLRFAGLTEDETSALCRAVSFGEPVTLELGVRASWDHGAEEAEVEHGLPAKDWRKTRAEERQVIPLTVLDSHRDVSRLLAMGVKRSVIGRILAAGEADTGVEQARALLAQASQAIADSSAISELLGDAAESLTQFVAGTLEVSVGHRGATDLDLLKQLEIAMTDSGATLPLRLQSSGLRQLAGFAFVVGMVEALPGSILLVDEPELSLHPQAQRALMKALQGMNAQVVMATHSSSLLDRADVRTVRRVRRTPDGSAISHPQDVGDEEARRLARFTNPQTAEAFFATVVILVEGISDQLALEVLAERLEVNLDRLGVSIVPIDGADTLRTFLRILGPSGLKLQLRGLCDADKEDVWRGVLEEEGFAPVEDRASMASKGFHVADRDLEDELVAALGEQKVREVIATAGDASALGRFEQQAANAGSAEQDVLRKFVGSRRRKVKYAPLLADVLDLEDVPHVLRGVLPDDS